MGRFLYETWVVAEGWVLSTFARLTGRPKTAERIWAAAMADLEL